MLSEASRIVYREVDDERTEVLSLALETGEELWSLADLPGEGQRGRNFPPKAVVASGSTMVLSGNSMDENIESIDETAAKQEHTVLLLGIDASFRRRALAA